MVLRRASLTRGFTLIEILISVSILVLLMGFGLFMTLDTYRGYSTRSEVDTVVALLTRARSHAMSNSEQSSWGVCINGTSYVLFRGTTCPVGSTQTVVFDQLTGDTSPTVITITTQGRTSTITINHEGTISW